MTPDQMMSLLVEFYPYIKNEAYQALTLGPPDDDHFNNCQNTCPDCQWYNWGLSFQERFNQGEFNEIINKFNQ